MSDKEITLNVRDISARELEAGAEGLGVTFEDQLDNVDPITGTIIIAGVLAAGKLLIRVWREVRGGTVVDLTKSPTDVSRNRDLPYGFFMVIAKDGSVQIDPKDEPTDALERMVTAVLKLGVNATVDALKKAIGETLTGTSGLETAPE